ncbi:hypothetical protein KI387_023498 [Taxus chinensis]|uniref:Crossover junction endonuclease MUS81 n=2 Tax=Taxus chinensis TaxID=29808 RepID=A0AA38L817_TAXCH|nr:hypothetical protein KI387_023498 [Taxus chinensis]
MASRRNVACPENETLAKFVFEKWEEMAVKETFTDRLNATFSKAYKNLCDHKDPIFNLKGASKIKGVRKWMLTLLKQYFESNKDDSSQEVLEPRGEKFFMWFGYEPRIVLSDAELVRQLLSSKNLTDSGRSPMVQKMLSVAFGKGLLTVNGQKWSLTTSKTSVQFPASAFTT